MRITVRKHECTGSWQVYVSLLYLGSSSILVLVAQDEDEEDFLGVESWTSTEGALPLRCPSRGEDLAVMGVGLSVMEGCYW